MDPESVDPTCVDPKRVDPERVDPEVQHSEVRCGGPPGQRRLERGQGAAALQHAAAGHAAEKPPRQATALQTTSERRPRNAGLLRS